MGLLLSCVGRIGDLSLSDDITQNRIHQNSVQGMLGEDGLFLQHVDSGHGVLFPLKDPSYE